VKRVVPVEDPSCKRISGARLSSGTKQDDVVEHKLEWLLQGGGILCLIETGCYSLHGSLVGELGCFGTKKVTDCERTTGKQTPWLAARPAAPQIASAVSKR
jgi:hypothetical protein